MNENKTDQATPDQLLEILDLQIAAQRGKRHRSSRHRGLILAGGVLLIIAGALVAFLVLQQMLLDMPRPDQREEPTTGGSTAHQDYFCECERDGTSAAKRVAQWPKPLNL